MEKTFVAVAEARPGDGWQRAFAQAWLRVRPSYLREGLDARPTVAEASPIPP